jgi:FAD/FMN-containing dehydrogenase/Fe-S oxidoreductase
VKQAAGSRERQAPDRRPGPQRLREAQRRGVGPEGGHGTLRPEGIGDIDVRSLRRSLEHEVRGEVLFDAGTRAAYSHDSSNYRQPPVGVVLPRDAEDVAAAVTACREHGAPVLPRGCGTSLAGQTCNVAVVLDCSKHMRRIVDVDEIRRLARVQPGVIRDQLADQTEERFHLTFAPDTSTHAYATFGGMLGNNSCGTHSVMAGRTADNTIELDVVLYDGTRLRVGETPPEELDRIIAAGARRGEIYAGLRDLRDRYAALVRERYPQIPRRVSGYNLDELLPEHGFNVARALVGSEGTCATILEATVRLVPSPPERSLVVCGYDDVFHAADHVPEILEHGPLGLEGLDDVLIRDMKILGEHVEDLGMLPEGKGWLLVEFGGESIEEADERARECMDALRKHSDAPRMELYDKRPNEAKLWDIRESGLGATAFIPGEDDHWEGWEDAAVPPENLGSYLRGFRDLLNRNEYRTSLYGHFGDGCVHCRIDFGLRSPGGLEQWRAFLDDAADLVVDHGGSLSGEHGDGQSRAELLEKMYGPELVGAFREFKSIWDPDGRMNPHKVVDPYPIVSNMKLGAGYNHPEPATQFAYPEDGGSFSHAALRCVGAGKCRDASSGTMCPSYMVTLDEEHSTRGRARILYEMLEGNVITDGWRSDEVRDALDLCLSCKGCKADCPVNVDMATYKAEFLAKHYKRRLRPRQAYSMGLIMFHARLAMLAPGLVNAVTGAPVLGGALKRLGGISAERAMPSFATETFKHWFAGRTPANPGGPPVVLFPDTFNDHLHPEVLKATTEVLEGASFHVHVPREHLCCGRPLYDYGMLDTAGLFWKRMLAVLRPQIQAGVHVVGAEPSCVAAFRDELPNMLPHDEDAKRLSLQALTLAELLDRQAPPTWEPPKLHRKAIVHSHCHHDAAIGFDADRKLIERMGLEADFLDSGCCGMAGSFGFEDEHYEISVKVGERRLLPAAREAAGDTLVIADGFSCKTQVGELTDRRPLHLAQVMKMAREHGPNGPPGSLPERLLPDVEAARPDRRAVWAAAAAGGGALAGLTLGARRRRR